MICRVWRGWTIPENADAYERYLKHELFPRVERELAQRGYRDYHLLRLQRGSEIEFMTMLWFDSIDAVRSFAGENFEMPVISAKAKAVLSRDQERCDHYELSGATSTLGKTS